MSEHSATGDWPAPSAVVEWPTVPGHEIIEELGRGGMGVVYKARHLSSQRLVALKLMRDGLLAGPEERARFRLEAEAAACVHHPNVVQIHEVGDHAGRLYFAMELVQGGSLDKHLAGRPQPAAEAAQLVRIVALAVQHAHELKVVHRDLKPANILLQIADGRLQIEKPDQTADSQNPQSAISNLQSAIAKITDFGLAKRLDSDSTAWTQTGAVLGTASYMAPEQAAGRVHEIGPAVDIYALGVILYELLTGRPPFQADSPNQTVQQVFHDEPTPPARRQPDVPRDLDTVCLKCLEKEPGRRYASARELADDLGRFLEGKPVAAVPLAETERMNRLAGRDGYQIVAEIGAGPRSTVYHALQGPLKQAVALKVFRTGLCTREQWDARLRRAAEIGSALAHPHIVSAHQAGWLDGAPYVAIEYVPHGSLAAKLAGQPYPLPQAFRLIEQLAEIVGYLHRQGIVHGNLKPSNVLLAADGIPRVVDLHPTGGLFLSPRPGAADSESHDHGPAGLGYLAPELIPCFIEGTSPELRANTDIYGLGLIFYELLAGRPAFAADTADETLERVRRHDPVPPSRFNSLVTPHLDAFCLRCLRKNPWRRYARAYDLVRGLRYFQENPQGRPEPGERISRRPQPGREDGGK